MRCRVVVGFLLALFLLLAPKRALADEGGSLYYGGVVFTGRAAGPDASWFVVRDGVVVALGDGDGIPTEFASLSDRIDLRGQFVAPGFIDAHVHFIDGGLSLLQSDLAAFTRLEEIARAVEAARRTPIGGFLVLRNLGLEPTAGALPTHHTLAPALARTGELPVIIALKGGHHVYANPQALAKLGIDRKTKDPEGGRILRDSSGESTGILSDQAAWDVMRKLGDTLTPEEVSRAILAAERLALSYGITSIADNTFAPSHLAKMVELAKSKHFRIRVSARSFGPMPITKMLMKPMGEVSEKQIRYFGEKYFVDRSFGIAGEALASETGDDVRYAQDELEAILRFAGRYGTAFHTQTREGTSMLVEARLAVRNRRRDASFPDVIDHCGSCSEDLPEKLKEAGFRVTVLPGQLHDLPELTKTLDDATLRKVLPLRELFDSGLAPALTSDWPYGVERAYAEIPDSFHRIGFAPLAQIAVAVSGRDPLGEPIAHADTRTITIQQAMRGYGPSGAAAMGRADDLGRIDVGYIADFVVLPRSPFEVSAIELYEMPVLATYLAGEKVFDIGAPEPISKLDEIASEHASTPWGLALSPILGYDPTPGFLLGGAAFVFPYRESGVLASAQLIVAPAQTTFGAEIDIAYRNAFPHISPRFTARIDTQRDRYYGFGMNTSAGSYLLTRPLSLEGSAGLSVHLTNTVDISGSALYGYLQEHEADVLVAASEEGLVQGSYAGARLEVSHDTRDEVFSARRGGKESVWLEAWGLQGDATSPRYRLGAKASRFLPLYAPDLVLALRLEGAIAFGERAYLTSYSLGGADLLRGYIANRFRGDAFATGSAELRFPIWSFISGAAFGEAGRVFLLRGENQGPAIGLTSGAGLRFGLPPDGLVKLRFDAGFARDEWGIFFKFGEAF